MPDPKRADSVNGDKPDLLDAGMEVAFGATSNGPQGTGSVLEALCASAKDIPTILLRDVLGDQPGIVDAHSPELLAGGTRLGRFQISGEIARGGMGVILRGRDSDLGRDVAIKVLRTKHSNNAEMIRRFVEEAQIGGQLEHPSILPIHELGIGVDRRPFFTMRMVQGDTLAKALQERKDPRRDLRRFLSIFQQVCQAVAYAHARGVVHRDLKPSNIMLGSFGEVQVMDWGLAKVLTRGGTADDARRTKRPKEEKVTTIRSVVSATSSSSGSVIGTPQYMSPEQALGKVEDLDERADVFSLGAILCEILTGEPPYVGQNGDSIRRKAAKAELGRAGDRLKSCGADKPLVRVAWSCLRPERDARPREAGVLAKELAAYVAELDERARAAELDAAEAKVRAEGERRARKLTLGLAASVLVTFMVGGGVWWAWEESARARLAQEESVRAAEEGKIRDVFSQAVTLTGIAQDGETGEVEPWLDARNKVQEAVAMLGTTEENPGLRADIEALRDEITRGFDNAEAVVEQRLEDEKFLQSLARIRELPDYPDELGHEEHKVQDDEAFKAAFAGRGISVDELLPEQVVSAFADREIAPALGAFFDRWAAVRRQREDFKTEGWEKLVQIAKGLDSDEWRNGFRQRLIAGRLDDSDLVAMSSDASLEALDSASRALLAHELMARKLWEPALVVLEREWREHPNSPWVASQRLDAHSKTSPPDYEAAVAAGHAWVALDPSNPDAWLLLGNSAYHANRVDTSIVAFREAIRLDNDFANAMVQLGMSSLTGGAGLLDEALVAVRAAIDLDRDNSKYHNALGLLLTNKGLLDEAIVVLDRAIELDETNSAAYDNLSQALLRKGLLDESIANQQRAVDLAKDKAQPYNNFGFRLLARGLVDKAFDAYTKAIDLDPKHRNAREGLARALAAKGDYEGAVSSFEAAIALGGSRYQYRELSDNLTRVGRYREAIATYERNLDTGIEVKAAQEVLEARRLLRDERRLLTIVWGDQPPNNALELVYAAKLASHRRLFAASARLWTEAFEMDPRLSEGIFLRNRDAAFAAVEAASGSGEDAGQLTAEERTALRKQALSWLRPRLQVLKAWIAGSDLRSLQAGLFGLGSLLSNSSLWSVREPEALLELPQEEAEEWRRFWDEVKTLLEARY